MVVVPKLGGDEQVGAVKPAGLNSLPNGLSHLLLVSVALGTIEVAEPSFKSCPGCVSCLGRIGNERAESQGGHRACSSTKRQLAIAESVGLVHIGSVRSLR